MASRRIVAIVTGGSSGLGAAATASLLQHGAHVVVADLQDAAATNVMRTPYVQTDVTDPEQVERALDVAEQEFGEPVSVAVNCAGIAIARKTLSKDGPHPLHEFQKVLTVNTVGAFNVSRLAATRMKQRPVDANGLRGCLIQTASIAAYEGQIGQVAYATSKAAVVGMTLPLARDLAADGIRVMTIAPGLFSTPLLDGLPKEVQQELGASVPCPSRLGNPVEFGQLVMNIVENPMLNGSVIRLDGALRMPP